MFEVLEDLGKIIGVILLLIGFVATLFGVFSLFSTEQNIPLFVGGIITLIIGGVLTGKS